jgi:hypothetical protein
MEELVARDSRLARFRLVETKRQYSVALLRIEHVSGSNRSSERLVPSEKACSAERDLWRQGRFGVPRRLAGSKASFIAGVPLFFLEEGLLDLIVDSQQPLLGARGAVAKMRSVGLGFPQPFLGGAQLE